VTPALWTSEDAARATGGRSIRAWVASGIGIDSRTIASGDLFIALPGTRTDGHDFVGDAFRSGAAAAMVSYQPPDVGENAPLLIVADTLTGLTALGKAARDRTNARIIAVTGSVGKTGTKEALKLALSAQGPTTATAGNLNNLIGTPLSLARMPVDTAFGVFEIGMNQPGEIATLSRLVRPHVAVITTIEPVHTQFFDSVADIADAKAEIFLGMRDGVAILHRDNPYFPWLADAAERAGVTRIIGFGAHPEATARLIHCELHPSYSRVTAVIEGTAVEYRINSAGRHWVINSLAVLAAVGAVGADVATAAAELSKLAPLEGRGKRHRVAVPGGSFEILDETYNASPASMRAAIAVLAGATPGNGGRRIAVLGDMLELGRDAPRLHAALAKDLIEADIDLVFTTAAHMQHLSDALPENMRGAYAATAAELAPVVAASVVPGDVVTVKGSHGTGMAIVVQALLALNIAPPRAANGY